MFGKDVNFLADEISLSGVPPCTEATSSAVPPLDPEVREDLVHILKLNREKIITQYAHYVYSMCDCVVDRGVTVQRLCTFLLKLPAFTPDNEHQGTLVWSEG